MGDDGNGNVMKYFIQETNRRLEEIEKKLDDLTAFKVGMLTSSKITATIVSVIVSIVTGVLVKVLT